LVLNKRYIVKRGRDVDVQSLLRNVAGSVTMATDVEGDVKALEFNDVTGSSYQEQDRLNMDFDELTGNFSTSSVATNRKLNETVGGMQMLGGAANQLTEYGLRTLTETWVEPVLNQLVKLEQQYETDQTILGLAGQAALPTIQRYGLNELTDEMLDQELTVRVNVGMGATDPQTKLGKFTHAMQTYAGIMSTMQDADPVAVRKELFGLAGYRDGGRFFKQGQDPKDAQMQQMGQMLQAATAEVERLKKDNAAKSMQAMAAADLSLANVDLVQAQTVKTLTEAAMVPSQAMAKQATEVDRA
jgi:hypothetical protein